jgi:predicted RNA-binding protein YlqC (UPF0109 family)
MKDLVKAIVEAIVDDPKSVKVNEIEGSNTSIIEVRCKKTDLGKLIGKEGRTATAIRNIIFAASFKTKKRYNLDINSND